MANENPYLNANQLQVSYNDQLNDYNKNLFGDSVKFGALQNTKKSIAEVREKREASFAQSENERWNKPNTLADATSSLGPMIPLDTTKPKGDALGDGLGNNIVADGNNNAFKNNATNAAASMYGTNIENSFDREIPPVTAIETNQDTTGMNSLYNKTI
jgi:hypothetical protein